LARSRTGRFRYAAGTNSCLCGTSLCASFERVPLTFRLLGPLEVWEDGREILLGTGRQRALLGLLLVHANQAMSADRLIEELWAGSPPASAQKVLQGYVSQLRRALPPETIVTQGPGYVLVAGETDAQEFARLVDAASTREAGEAASLLRRALALWRDRPLAEFEYEEWARAEIARLGQQRLAALEDRIDADLQLGRHAQVVAELEALVAEHPLRERLLGQLMLALYRSGRQADALDAYRRGRRTLVDELGLEPGPDLDLLEKQILTHDDAVAAPPRRLPVPAALARRGRVVALVGALVLAAALAAAAWELAAGGHGGPVGVTSRNAVVDIDPSSGQIVARVAVGKTPTSLISDDGAVWAAGADGLTRIDPKQKRIVATLRTGAVPVDLAVGVGGLWLANGRGSNDSGLVAGAYPTSVSRLDPSSLVATRTVSLTRSSANLSFKGEPGASVLAIADRAIWAIGPDQGVSRIDPASGRVIATVEGLGAVALAASGHSVWVDDGVSTLTRIDTRTDHAEQRISLGASSLNGIAVGAGAVWVTDPVDGTVWRVDSEPRPVTRTIAVGIGVTGISVGSGAVWASNPFLGTVSRIDPSTNTVTRVIDVAGTPQSLSAGAGGVWVSVTGTSRPGPNESRVQALPAATCGPVLTGGGDASVLIASDLPLQGGSAATTLEMTRAIQFVLQRHHFRAGKYEIGYQSCDDSTAQSGYFDFATCGANANAYARDSDLLGVIGPIDSSCAQVEIPIMNRAAGGPMALVGTLTTNSSLTHPGRFGPTGWLHLLYPTGRRNFMRIVAPDDLQGAAQAVLARRLGLEQMYVLSDGQEFAGNLTTGFDAAARTLGLKVVGTSRWNPDARSYGSLALRVRRSGADGVLLAGLGGPGAGRLVRALRQRLGGRFPLIAGDGFLTIPYLLQTAGPAARGMYVTFAGRPNDRLPAPGRAFLRAFSATQSNPRVASYAAAYAAQAAEVLLAAIADSDGTRASVLRRLFTERVRNGILGDFSFTSDGDMTPSPVTIFRVIGGKRPSSTHLKDFDGAVVDRVVNVPATLAP
jgi:DNA-binding SARP family transcriptional activator/ABC-type branched-subunit amino acid transport system substrate-binding protein